MNETPVEPTNLNAPEEPDVELAPFDPIREVHVLREVNRRWRRAAIGSGLVAVLLLVVSAVQFAGTFITCRLLKETQEEAARNRERVERCLPELQSADEKATRTIEKVRLLELRQQQAVNTQMCIMVKKAEQYSEFQPILENRQLEALRRAEDQYRKLLKELQIDVAEARESLIAVESMRLLLEKDEEARARTDPRTYADPRQRCPFVPGTGRKPPESE